MNKWRFETYVLVTMISFRSTLYVLVPIALAAAPVYGQQQWGGGGIGASASPEQRLANSRVHWRRMRVFSESPSVSDTAHAPRATGGDWNGSQPQWGGAPPAASRPEHATPQAYIPTVVAGTTAIPTYDPAAVRAHYMQRFRRP